MSGRRRLHIRYAAFTALGLLFLLAVVTACGGSGQARGTAPETPGPGPLRPEASDGQVSSGGLAEAIPPVTEGKLEVENRAPAGIVQNLARIESGDRFIIETIGVDAPLSYRRVALDGVMPRPEGPDDVAYYDFSDWTGKGGAPGKGGNAVFAGEVDSGSKPCQNGTVAPPCEAVLWDLNRLKAGDVIELRIDGQSFRYRVVSNVPVDAETGPWDQIVSATAQETITVITCAGNFNRETRTYSDRQVVTAVRI
jgi:hypothetical protein